MMDLLTKMMSLRLVLRGHQIYFPMNIAQYGFILHTNYLSEKNTKTLQKLKAVCRKTS